MSNAQMTPWFPASVKPVRTGVYEVQLARGPVFNTFAFWTGDRWGAMSSVPEMASTQKYAFADWSSQNKRWRGFTDEQK